MSNKDRYDIHCRTIEDKDGIRTETKIYDNGNIIFEEVVEAEYMSEKARNLIDQLRDFEAEEEY